MFGTAQSPSSNIEEVNEHVDTLFDLDLANIEGQLFWDMVNTPKCTTPSLRLDGAPHTMEVTDDSLSWDKAIFQPIHAQITNHTPNLVVNSSLSAKLSNGLRSFTQLPAIQGGALTTSMLMVRILVSYPMMLRDIKSPPPFIHPHSLSGYENISTESLTTCANLIQMVGNGGHGSRNLLWKNVRLECERLQVQVGNSIIADIWH
jgi:hypothetical protein